MRRKNKVEETDKATWSGMLSQKMSVHDWFVAAAGAGC